MKYILAALLIITVIYPVYAEDESSGSEKGLKVKITRTIPYVDIKDENGKTVRIQRNQDTKNRVIDIFSKTSRKCPPFCIQPMTISPRVETIGERQMLDYLERKGKGDGTIVVIDSRGADWVRRGSIPGAINLHWKKLTMKHGNEEEIAEIFEDIFGVQRTAEFWNFADARTLVLFCNGVWCGQSPTNIRSLLRLGYPPEKLKWYRGGMQNWEILGLTTTKTK
ncbi:MAG: rhodanese-like domain-containing protein [Gammaproteobacteria bacterium]|nr:rhodanese-like domain-containing protein [Gammaproteobacteria bacterium]